MTKRAIPPGFQVVPSLLSADFGRLSEEIQTMERAGVQMLHLDVMDGHFVPNITFGPPLVRCIRRATDLFLDTHLMITDPLAYIEPFADAGADLLTLHVEALSPEAGFAPTPDALRAFDEAARKLRGRACGLGLTLRPGTDPSDWLERVGAHLDLVLVMSVEPGFGGQAFMPEMLQRLRAFGAERTRRGLDYRLEVDGGITPDTAPSCADAGAEILVAGSAVFGAPDRAEALRRIRAAGEGHL